LLISNVRQVYLQPERATGTNTLIYTNTWNVGAFVGKQNQMWYFSWKWNVAPASSSNDF